MECGGVFMIGSRGTTTKEMILLFCILLFCLLMICYYAESFPSEKSSSESSSSNIDYDYYYNYERKMNDAASKYLKKYDYNIPDGTLRIELDTLIKESLIKKFYDKNSDNICDGYVVVTGEEYIKSYLICDEYSTVG